MKYNTLIIISTLVLSGCGSIPSGSASSSNLSETQYVRNAQGQTVYRITDSRVFTPDGRGVARIDSSGNVFNTNGTRVARIVKK